MFLRLSLVVAGYCFGAFFFFRGFLLTRHTVQLKSSCSDVQHPVTSNGSLAVSGGCWVPASYKKAILLVVDALRYDFVAEQVHSKRLYHNRFRKLQETLEAYRKQSLLFKFVAHPPTTTLQRLNGLTTGSLPTFIDAGSNFAGSAIEEDNIIGQLVSRGKRVTFMGDDTWMALFPNHFHRSFPFPSFDVQDLHTVDNGVLRHLYNEMNRTDWDLLIAHFLGVDHCGHKYGPNHPEMSKKLSQMDEVIRNVTQLMDEETLLFVFGDHGMTETGDHGGDSDDELGAALFVYGKSEIHNEKQNVRRLTDQLSIVPTFALLLDIPIPYSNLGAIIPELFTRLETRLQAARVNVHQVIRYTETYLRNFRDDKLLQRFSPLLKLFNSLEPDELTTDKSVEIVRRMGAVFLDCWAKFHLGWMLLGILAIFENLLSSAVMIRAVGQLAAGRRMTVLKALHLALFLWATLARNESVPPIIGIVLGIEVTAHFYAILTDMLTTDHHGSVVDLISMLLLAVHASLVFSNSYIVHEDSVSRHFMNAYFLLVVALVPAVKLSGVTSVRRRAKTLHHYYAMLTDSIRQHPAILALAAVLLIRLSAFYRRCREEIANCTVAVLLLPFGSVFESRDRLLRSSMVVVAVALLYLIPYNYLKSFGAIGRHSYQCLWWKLCLRCMCFFTLATWCYSWLTEMYPKLTDDSVALFFPRACYAVALLFVALYFANPMDVNATLYSSVNDLLGLSKSDLAIVGKLKCQIETSPRVACARVYLFGAQFAVVNSWSFFLWMLTMTFALLLGDAYAFSLVNFVLLLGILLTLGDSAPHDLWKSISLVELANHGFYAFGHQPTFASIPWDAAFVGIPGNFNFMWLQAILVIANIAASFVLVAFALPLILTRRRGANVVGDAQSLQSFVEQSAPGRHLFRLNMLCLSSMGLKLLFCSAACAMHRRHLMLWKIFAPKLIFESTLFFAFCVSLLLQYALFLYLQYRLQRLFNRCRGSKLSFFCS